jgi:hypothetical protein
MDDEHSAGLSSARWYRLDFARNPQHRANTDAEIAGNAPDTLAGGSRAANGFRLLVVKARGRPRRFPSPRARASPDMTRSRITFVRWPYDGRWCRNLALGLPIFRGRQLRRLIHGALKLGEHPQSFET